MRNVLPFLLMFYTPETGIEPAAQGIKVCVENLREKFPKAPVVVVKIFPAHRRVIVAESARVASPAFVAAQAMVLGEALAWSLGLVYKSAATDMAAGSSALAKLDLLTVYNGWPGSSRGAGEPRPATGTRGHSRGTAMPAS